MGRWDELKKFLEKELNELRKIEKLNDFQNGKYGYLLEIINEMSFLEDSIKTVEVEVPETDSEGHCSLNCRLRVSNTMGYRVCADNRDSTDNIDDKDHCKPGPDCPRHVKGEKE